MKIKRIMGLVLAVLMVVSTFSVGAFAEEQTQQETESTIVNGELIDGWESGGKFNVTAQNLWEFNRTTGVLTIRSNTNSPWDWNETGKISASDSLKQYASEIEEIVLVGNISKFTKEAFKGLTNLKKLTITEIIQVDNAAFDDCPNIETICVTGSVEIPGVLDFSTIVGSSANGLNSFSKSNVFNSSTKATGVILSDIYSSTAPLRKGYLPDNIQTIYGSSEYLETFCEANELEFVPFGKTSNKAVAWTIKNGVMTIIGNGAISDLGTKISAYAEEVTQVVIPETITEIGDGAFAALTNLVSAKFTGNSPVVAENAKPFGDRDASFKVIASEGAEGFEGETWNGYVLELLTYVSGDANGDSVVDIYDAIILEQSLAGWQVEIDDQAADCNGDGEVDINDALLLKQHLAGWKVEFAGPSAP